MRSFSLTLLALVSVLTFSKVTFATETCQPTQTVEQATVQLNQAKAEYQNTLTSATNYFEINKQNNSASYEAKQKIANLNYETATQAAAEQRKVALSEAAEALRASLAADVSQHALAQETYAQAVSAASTQHTQAIEQANLEYSNQMELAVNNFNSVESDNVKTYNDTVALAFHKLEKATEDYNKSVCASK